MTRARLTRGTTPSSTIHRRYYLYPLIYETTATMVGTQERTT